MNRRNVRKLLIVVAVIAALSHVGRPVLTDCIELLIDRVAQPLCHKGLDGRFKQWQSEHQTREFPNIRGESWASMQVLPSIDYMPELKSHYSYVPGLNRDDPGNLVLMYVNQPTRWTWHGSPPVPWVFTEKAWILVPVDMKIYGNRDRDKLPPGEFSERVPFDEFRQRLEKTLDFLKAHKRPNWEAVVNEHTEFLKRAAQLPQQ